MKSRFAIAVLLTWAIGCQRSVLKPTPPHDETCRASNASEALSFAYEPCLRRHLKHLSYQQVDLLHKNLPKSVRMYLVQRTANILGHPSRTSTCKDDLPLAYCELLSARSLEQRGLPSEARVIYKRLTKTAKLPNNALAGLIRTETFPDTKIPSTAEAHPDYLAATCAQMVKHAPNHLFRTVVSNCFAQLNESSEILSEVVHREWLFGLKEKAIRRLETHLHVDPLDHRIRSQLALYLFDINALKSAIDHSQKLIEHRSATIPIKLKFISGLIQTRQFSRATQALADFSPQLSKRQTRRLKLKIEAQQGICKALPPLYDSPSILPIKAIEDRIEVLRGTPCAKQIEGILYTGLKEAPDNPEVWTKLIEHYLASDQYELGRKTLSEILPRFSQYAPLAFLAAQMQYNKGHYDLAADLIERARILEPKNLKYQHLEMENAFRQGKLPEAIELMTRLVETDRSNLEVAKKLALAKLIVNDLNHAQELLAWLTEIESNDPVISLQYATTLARLERPIDAKGVLLRTIELSPDYDDAWALLAITHATLDEHAEAAYAFQRALALTPSHPHLRMAYARFLESQSMNELARTQYARLLARDPINSDASAAMNRLNEASNQRLDSYNRALENAHNLSDEDRQVVLTVKSPAVVLNDQRDVRIEDNGDLTIDTKRSIFIKDSSAVKTFQSTEIPYDLNSKPKVLEATVITPDGHKIDIDTQKWVHKDPNEASLMYGDARILRADFSTIEPGSLIRYHIQTTLPKKPESMIWWDSYVLGNEVFTLSARYNLDAPFDLDYFVTGAGVTESDAQLLGDRIRRSWYTRHVPRFSELSQQAVTLPMIYLSSFKTWSEVDAWYNKLFAPATVLGPQLKYLAEQISASNPATIERIGAVIDAVEGTIDYEGIEYGVGAYLPRPAESSWRRRKGDCKDMVAVIVGLLKHMNISAYPVLVRPRDAGPFMRKYPSPSQFSHVVVMIVDEHNRQFWVDPTAKMGTLDALPALVRGASAFTVDGAGGKLITIPVSSPRESTIVETINIQLAEDALPDVTSNLSFRGDAAGWVRLYLREQREKGRPHHMKLPGLLLGHQVMPTTVNTVHVNNSHAPLKISSSGTYPVKRQKNGEMIFNNVLDPTETSLIALLNSAEQINPPRQFEKETTFTFKSPHTLSVRLRPIHLQGAIDLKIAHRQEGLTHKVSVRLIIDQAKVLKLNERQFFEQLGQAQQLMEQALIFKPLK